MARGQGIPASHALGKENLQHWFGTQPREVALTLSCRAGLRALPLLVTLWGRPNFQMLPFFRAAQSAWTYARYPGLAARGLGRASLATLSENSFAGAALMLAEAAPMPRARNNTSEFASRAIVSTTHADETLADPSLEEVMAVEAAGDFSARGAFAVGLASNPLWQEVPPRIDLSWKELRAALWTASDADWEVWIDWYEDRLAGRPSFGEAFDIAVATLANSLWEQGPKAVNARIKELIAEHTPPQPIPAQGAGPHFALNRDLKIALAPPADFDAEGNNLRRIREQLPLLRRAADDLAGNLNSNTHPELSRNLADYRAAIAGEPETIAWGIVFGLGVRLENAAAAAGRDMADRLHEPLEDAAQEALDTVLTLHGPLILATREGRELSEEADRFRLTRDQQASLRDDALAIAADLKNSPEIIEPVAAELGEKAAETIGEGDHPERGTAFGLAMVKNVATILVPAAGLGALAWSLGGIGENTTILAGAAFLHHNDRIRDAARAIGGDYHLLVDAALSTAKDQADLAKAQAIARLRLLTPFRDFVTANEKPLRRLAGYSTSLRWMLWYIDFIIRTNPNRGYCRHAPTRQ